MHPYTYPILLSFLVVGCFTEVTLAALKLERYAPATLVTVLILIPLAYSFRRREETHEERALRSFSETFRLMGELFGPKATLILEQDPTTGEEIMRVQCRSCGKANRLRKGIAGASCGACKEPLRRLNENTAAPDRKKHDIRPN